MDVGDQRWLGLPAGAAVAGLGYRSGALAPSGAVAAAIVGAATWAAGRPWALLLLTFFATASALTRWRGGAGGDAGQRTWRQVCANGGIATMLAGWSIRRPHPDLWTGFVGSLAAANADTWATEIGQALGGTPRRLTTGEPVAPGTSGGVTIAGTLGGVLGAVAIGLSAAAATRRARLIATAAAAGTIGMLLDSLLGDTLQARYHCSRCGTGSETPRHGCGQPARLVGGHAWLDNDTVNGAGAAAGALSALGLRHLARLIVRQMHGTVCAGGTRRALRQPATAEPRGSQCSLRRGVAAW